MGNLLPAQMQVMDFVAGLRPELAIITNGSNPADFNEVKETAKNVKSVSLINKNGIAVVTNPAVAKVKELKPYKKLGYVFYTFCIHFVYVFKKSMVFIRNWSIFHRF